MDVNVVTAKAWQATKLILNCLWIGCAVLVVFSITTEVFSPPNGGSDGWLRQAHQFDPNNIAYWPSIDELQWFAGTNRDGVFRKLSQDAYEARRGQWYCDMSARATWPKRGLMTQEAK